MNRPSTIGCTLVSLLVVFVLSGVIVGLSFTAIQHAREAANRSACKNNLKQHAFGFENHQDQRGDATPLALFNRGLSWSVLSIPYLEGWGGFARLRLEETFEEQQNQRALHPMGQCYLYHCYSRRRTPQWTNELVAGDYAVPSIGVVASNNPTRDDTWMQAHDPKENLGPFLVVWRTKPLKFGPAPPKGMTMLNPAAGYHSQTSSASWLDGEAHQIILGEKALHPDHLNTEGQGGDFTIGAWIENDFNASDCTRNGAAALVRSAYEDYHGQWSRFGSWHPNICQFAYADGRVEPMNNDVSRSVLYELCHRGSAKTSALSP
ncbi:MAG: DUF1559 domain-containing protein [Pirellulaceae bacterium]